MGDIWLPGFPPAYTNWGSCVIELQRLGMDRSTAEILAAIGGPESGYDYTVINDTPATGDYSVGIWQINYYAGLYSERTALFGTPRHLVECGLPCQAQAAIDIYNSQGFMAWSTTYTSGRWKAFIGSGPIPTAPGFPGSVPPPPPTDVRSDDWSHHVHATGKEFRGIAARLKEYATVVREVSRR